MTLYQWLDRSVDRMVVVTLTCGLLSAAGIALGAWLRASSFGASAWASFLFSFAGFLLMTFLAWRLRGGVENERWPLEENERWRSRTLSELWFGLMVVGFLLMIAAMVQSLLSHSSSHGRHSLYWSYFIAVQTLSQIASAFRSSSSSGIKPAWRGWKTYPKLSSERWGER